MAHARVFRAETGGQDSIAIDEVLKNIQIDLFVLGADLATPKGKETSYLPRLDKTPVEALQRLIDELEVGREVSRSIRVGFEVADASVATERLVDAGAKLIAPPTETPWRSLNSRLEAPAGLQITLFEELEDTD